MKKTSHTEGFTLVELMLAAVEGRLDQIKVEWDARVAACVVLASGGYPGSFEKGKVIQGLPRAEKQEGVTLFHAGTQQENGDYVTSGGRVLGVTAVRSTLAEAIAQSYRAVSEIHFDQMHFRRDIGGKALSAVSPLAGSSREDES